MAIESEEFGEQQETEEVEQQENGSGNSEEEEEEEEAPQIRRQQGQIRMMTSSGEETVQATEATEPRPAAAQQAPPQSPAATAAPQSPAPTQTAAPASPGPPAAVPQSPAAAGAAAAAQQAALEEAKRRQQEAMEKARAEALRLQEEARARAEAARQQHQQAAEQARLQAEQQLKAQQEAAKRQAEERAEQIKAQQQQQQQSVQVQKQQQQQPPISPSATAQPQKAAPAPAAQPPAKAPQQPQAPKAAEVPKAAVPQAQQQQPKAAPPAPKAAAAPQQPKATAVAAPPKPTAPPAAAPQTRAPPPVVREVQLPEAPTQPILRHAEYTPKLVDASVNKLPPGQEPEEEQLEASAVPRNPIIEDNAWQVQRRVQPEYQPVQPAKLNATGDFLVESEAKKSIVPEAVGYSKTKWNEFPEEEEKERQSVPKVKAQEWVPEHDVEHHVQKTVYQPGRIGPDPNTGRLWPPAGYGEEEETEIGKGEKTKCIADEGWIMANGTVPSAEENDDGEVGNAPWKGHARGGDVKGRQWPPPENASEKETSKGGRINAQWPPPEQEEIEQQRVEILQTHIPVKDKVREWKPRTLFPQYEQTETTEEGA
ncbi:hypothetical protein niasHT_038041 [Heterodera trifolii]|uniref:Uncharacterized protein n=1 Tax=Heterodera trifolii TaxID=157864 RepID=A0ABD2HT26_9BILA